MPTDPPCDVFRHLRRAALLRDGGGLTDGQLLECFLTHRNEAAFEALLRRHGPMVLGVCRRVLRNSQDAEDAFQATFLVLVRKAAEIAQPELLGNWLYGVAYRTALDARSATARRRARERQVNAMPEPEVSDTADVWRDLRPLLDHELSRLPDKYRVPVVLCDLEGRTRREVAQQLGIPTGTLSGRLTTARRLLAGRLTRQGLVLSAGALTGALWQGAARVPAPLVISTVQAATAVAAGQAVAAVVSARVAALAQGMVKAMFVTRLKIATALLLVVGLLLGAGLLGREPGAAQSPAEENTQVAQAPGQEAQKAGPPRVLKLEGKGRRVAWSPDGKTLVVVEILEPLFFGKKGSAIKLWDVAKGEVKQTLAEDTGGGLAFQQVVYSADGKTIAATVSELVRKVNSLEIRAVVKVWDTKTLAVKQVLRGDSQLFCVALSPDGKRVAAGDPSRRTVKLWNAATGEVERTLSTGEVQPWSVAFSADSKALVVGGQKADNSGQVQLWDAQTWTLKHALDQDTHVTNQVAFSPDGKMVASSGADELVHLWSVEKGEEILSLKGHKQGHRAVVFSPDNKLVAAGGPDGKVRLWDVPSGALRETLEGHRAEIYSLAFSCDGKTLASASQDGTVRLWSLPRGNGEKK
jgi:RNA polymerase sigma factor (sigma-70 family)